MSNIAKRIKQSTNKITLDGWHLTPDEQMEKILIKMVREAIQNTLENFPPAFSLPFFDYQTKVKPLTLRLELSLGSGDCNEPEWDISLKDFIKEECCNENESPDKLLVFAKELMALAKEIEEYAEKMKDEWEL